MHTKYKKDKISVFIALVLFMAGAVANAASQGSAASMSSIRPLASAETVGEEDNRAIFLIKSALTILVNKSAIDAKDQIKVLIEAYKIINSGQKPPSSEQNRNINAAAAIVNLLEKANINVKGKKKSHALTIVNIAMMSYVFPANTPARTINEVRLIVIHGLKQKARNIKPDNPQEALDKVRRLIIEIGKGQVSMQRNDPVLSILSYLMAPPVQGAQPVYIPRDTIRTDLALWLIEDASIEFGHELETQWRTAWQFQQTLSSI